MSQHLPHDLIDTTLDITTQPHAVTCRTVLEVTPKRLEFLEGIRNVITQTGENPASELQHITDIVGSLSNEDANSNQTMKN